MNKLNSDALAYHFGIRPGKIESRRRSRAERKEI